MPIGALVCREVTFVNRWPSDVVVVQNNADGIPGNSAGQILAAATQPQMYRSIRRHPPVRTLYAERLLAANVIAAGEADKFVEEYRQALEQGRHQAHAVLGMIGNQYTVENVMQRMGKLRKDPWAGMARVKQALPKFR